MHAHSLTPPENLPAPAVKVLTFLTMPLDAKSHDKHLQVRRPDCPAADLCC
jgi:hypothetical protein